ncbi:MAG: E3 binding domain-containing protein, partial [Actinobacteria bacterium]|nr:E3 binding domain-containing protein [Actinomycetota bacterium]
MPRLSDSMEEGTVLAWRKRVGEQVALGEEIVEIETDKAVMGYEADVAGTLLEIVVQENESAPVGAVIARVGDPQASAASGTGSGRVKASPLARRIARARGVDLSSLTGSGPGGRIVRRDVEAAGAPRPPPPPP